MSFVWADEYDPSELDGFRIETRMSVDDVQDEMYDDMADQWLAEQIEYENNLAAEEAATPNGVE